MACVFSSAIRGGQVRPPSARCAARASSILHWASVSVVDSTTSSPAPQRAGTGAQPSMTSMRRARSFRIAPRCLGKSGPSAAVSSRARGQARRVATRTSLSRRAERTESMLHSSAHRIRDRLLRTHRSAAQRAQRASVTDTGSAQAHQARQAWAASHDLSVAAGRTLRLPSAR